MAKAGSSSQTSQVIDSIVEIYNGNLNQVEKLLTSAYDMLPLEVRTPEVVARRKMAWDYIQHRKKAMTDMYTQDQASYIIRTFGDPQENPTHLEMLESVTNYFDEEFWENYASLEDIVEELDLEDEEHEEALAFCHNPLIPVEIGT